MWQQTETGFRYVTAQSCDKILNKLYETDGNLLTDISLAVGGSVNRGIDVVTNWVGNDSINKFTDYFIKGPEYMSCKYGEYHLGEFLAHILDSLEPVVYFIGDFILGALGAF